MIRKLSVTAFAILSACVTVSALAQAPINQSSPVEMILTEDMLVTLRNPFRPTEMVQKVLSIKRSDQESYSVNTMVLNGVIAGLKKSKAMITLPNRKTVFVKVGDKVGTRDGHVVQIDSDGVRVLEYDKDEDGKLVPEYVQIAISNMDKDTGNTSGREE
jgi:Tfp pilus assembly protein PilP